MKGNFDMIRTATEDPSLEKDTLTEAHMFAVILNPFMSTTVA